jgi:outer membrane protein TolC
LIHLAFPPARLAAAALAILVVGGCQTYEPKPLDPVGSTAAWFARSPSDETVRAFADRLAASESVPVEPFDPSDGLTLREAEPVALVFNRRLRLARLEADVTRATSDFAGLWEDPVGGVDLERILSGVSNPWIVAATVGITLPISGRLEAEKAVAGASYAADLQSIAAKEWATRAALRELWLEWSAQVVRVELVNDLVQRLRDVSSLAARQQEAGVLSRIDARVFVVELAGREADATAAQARATELELQLRDVLGLAPDAPVRLVPSLVYAPRMTEDADLRREMASANADLAAIRSAYEVAEESLRLEIREQYPDLTIGPGYKNEDDDSRVLLGLSMPIPLWNRNQQGVAEATASREVARARYETTYEHVASRLAVALTHYRAGRAVREALEWRVVPLADEQDADVRRVAALGRVDPLLLLEAIQAQHAAKVRLTDSRAAESIGAVRLDELIGPPAPPPDITSPASEPEQPSAGDKR